MQNERKPDLNGPDDEILEKRVDKMMDPRLSDGEPTDPAELVAGSDEPTLGEPATAPELIGKKVSKEPIKVTVIHDEEPDELANAIEETNKKLAAEQLSETDEQAPSEAETTADPETSELPEEFNDEKIDKAVDEIVAQESDDLLAAEDEQRQEVEVPVQKPQQGSRLKSLLRGWWHNPISRWLTIGILVAVIVAAAAVPTTRYLTLNAIGVRSAASIQVIDQSTLQPLKDVEVKLADKTAKTDSNGTVKIEGLRLGPTQLVIEKRAFAQVNKLVTVGWGSNPLGNFNLSPVGTQYAFVVSDYLSGKPVASSAASAGDADANADAKGKIRLTMEHSEVAKTKEVTISASGYRDEKVSLDASNKQEIAIKLVPARKGVFISKRTGTYDVYKIDVDGKNEELVLAGTGSERDDVALIPHASDDVIAVVSTRENKRNADGYLLSTLTLIDLKDNTPRMVTQSEQVQAVSWLGDRLVYVQIAAGASAANPNRQRLMSYDHKVRDNKQLASANYFNDILIADGKIYYAPSNAYAGNQGSAFIRINADGTNKQQILAKETWNLFRTAYDTIVISAANEWYDYKLNATAPTKLAGQPGNINGRVYIDSPDSKRSLWVDNRDGKGVLLVHDIGTKSDKVLKTQSGLKNPVRWLNDRVILYRINTDQETADYALSLDGGEPLKIKDVTNTGGVDRWYYY